MKIKNCWNVGGIRKILLARTSYCDNSWWLLFFGGEGMPTVHMWSGDFQVLPQLTLGDMLIATLLFLILVFGIVRWFANLYWGGGD